MTIVIEPGRATKNYWRDLWHYRELMYFLAWRDVLVRYKQTAIGVAWALLRPALTMLVFVVFRRLTRVSAHTVPDPLLVLAAVLPWQLFSTALTEASGSLIGNANLISKVYFPRLLIPGAAVVTAVVDFVITLGLLAVLMASYGVVPHWPLVSLPLFILLTCALSLGCGLFFAALNVEYRDFRYIVPFVVQLGLFVSPLAFATTDVPKNWRLIYSLNPMVGIIDGFRWSLFAGEAPLDPLAVILSLGVTLLCMASGVWYFRRMERGFADII